MSLLESSVMINNQDDASIYIHIPFCKQACFYCDFHFSTNLKNKESLILALLDELELRKQELKDKTIVAIYFGGGTPSLLAPKDLERLIAKVYEFYKVSEMPEITLEANPDDLTTTRAAATTIFEDYKTIGINRLSIGIQSFFETDLKMMNRAHSAEEAKACLEQATRHFKNISIDLIYGIPDLSNERWIANIEIALSFGISHISSYALTVEPKTALESFIKKGIINHVDDALAQTQFYILVDRLEAAGFVHYELSNFGKPNNFSINNTAYWQGKSYLGIGPSAHSFNGRERSWNLRNNSKYIKEIQQKNLPLERETLSVTDTYNEYIMTGLRTIWGVSIEKVARDYGENYKKYLFKQSERYMSQNLLHIENGKLLTTKKGKFLSDGIASHLFKINLS